MEHFKFPLFFNKFKDPTYEPLLAQDTAGSTAAAAQIHAQVDRPNLFVKIPGTPEGIPAIEALIFAGVPI